MAAPEKVKAFLAEPRNVVIAGLRRNGEPHLSPNWFYFDGERFYVSTTRARAKYAVFRRNPRAVLLVDDSTGARYVRVPVTVEVREDLAAELPRFRAIREKMGVAVPSDAEFLAWLGSEGRVLLAMTPDGPQDEWTIHGLD
ncbi:MAG TPA: pyridoxamine 5'-phosphate oxidase family protein [Streptosporangiaceae bacterium]|nr:pyridoxamine 5'-phosphate oxidase family protein [Streptosporangiaceae bacterium]